MKNFILILSLLFASISFGQTRAIDADYVLGTKSVRNYIKNGGAELVGPGWTCYNDGAVARPIDGVGGSATVTMTRSSTGPLDKDFSWIFTHPASNTQGQGCSYSFTVPESAKAKVLQIELDYKVDSGTFSAGTSSADSDEIVYIYDVTNSQLIEPTTIKFLSNSASITDKLVASFQTSSTGTQYKLILHSATTTTAAHTLKIDEVSITKSNYIFGTPITDWAPYLPTYTGLGTVTSQLHWRRVGDSIEIRGTITTGTVDGNPISFSLPAGLTFETNKLSALQGTDVVGTAFNFTGTAPTSIASTSVGPFALFADTSASNNLLYLSRQVLSNKLGKEVGTLFANNSILRFDITSPIGIKGWSSSVQMSDQADARSVNFVGYPSTNQALTANVTNVNLVTIKDTHGAWTGSSYVVPVSGDYEVNAVLLYNSAASFQVYLNTVNVRQLVSVQNGAHTAAYAQLANLKAGDVISFRADTGATITGTATAGTWTIKKQSGTFAVAATDSVNCAYNNTAGTSITSSFLTMPFATKIYDTHNAYNTSTGIFTAPAPGKYRLTAHINSVPFTQAFTGSIKLQVVQGGSVSATTFLDSRVGNNSNIDYHVTGSAEFNLLAGDTLAVQVQSSTSTSLLTTAGYNNIYISRIGN